MLFSIRPMRHSRLRVVAPLPLALLTAVALVLGACQDAQQGERGKAAPAHLVVRQGQPQDSVFLHRGRLYWLTQEAPYSGPYTVLHSSGDTLETGQYQDGQKHGSWRYYYPGGQLKTTGAYQNNVQQGPWVVYHPNGQVAQRGNFRNGQPVNDWQFFDATGQPTDPAQQPPLP